MMPIASLNSDFSPLAIGMGCIAVGFLMAIYAAMGAESGAVIGPMALAILIACHKPSQVDEAAQDRE